MELLKDEMADVRLNAIKVQTLSAVRMNTVKVNLCVESTLFSTICVMLRVLDNIGYTAFYINSRRQLKYGFMNSTSSYMCLLNVLLL